MKKASAGAYNGRLMREATTAAMELATRPERSARVSFTIHLKAFSLLLYALPFGGRASSLLIMGGHAGK